MWQGAWKSRGPGATFVALLCAAGCGSSEDPTQNGAASSSGPAGACPPGQRVGPNGGCLAAGIQSDGCDAGEHSVDGDCRPAGIAPDACGAGFAPTKDGGCAPILPATSCPAGQIAVPGETACHPLADCGSAPWGDAPSDPTTRYVDAAYSDTGSDGSQAKPFTKIQDAVDAATSGAVIAIAAGTYPGTVLIAGKSVELAGRCPEMVELVGGDPAAIEIGVQASGTRIRTLAIRGTASGIVVSGAKDVVVERVWIHDTPHPGLWVESLFAPSQATLDRAIVEATKALGVYVAGANATIQASTVRDIAESFEGTGDGIWVEATSGSSAELDVIGSVIERAHESGVYGKFADVTVEGSVIRDNIPLAMTGFFGVGVGAEGATVRLRHSLLSGNRDAAVFANGSDVSVETSVIRDTDAAADGQFGRGINVEPSAGKPSTLTVSDSVLDNNSSTGIYVGGSTATINATIVRATRPRPFDRTFGIGIDVEDSASATVRSSILEKNHDIGLFVFGAEGSIEGTVVRDTLPRPGDLQFGRGIEADPVIDPAIRRSKLTVDACRVERSTDFGIYVGASDATIEATVVDDTRPRAVNLWFGRGIGVESYSDEPANVSITHSVVSRSRDYGIYVLDSAAVLESVLIQGTMARDDGKFGDGLGVSREELDYYDKPLATVPAATVHVTLSRIEQSARAGVTSFGGAASIGGVVLECNPVSLDGEKYEGVGAEFEDRGANVCGCKGAVSPCVVLSASLEPPVAAGEYQH